MLEWRKSEKKKRREKQQILKLLFLTRNKASHIEHVSWAAFLHVLTRNISIECVRSRPSRA